MSHLVTRLFADRCADAAEGVGACLFAMRNVLHGTDQLLNGDTITIASDSRDDWVARGMAPDEEDPEITYPLIRIWTLSVDYGSGVPESGSDGTFFVSGTVQIVAQPILRDTETATAAAIGMYVLRALRNVVIRWDDPSNYGDVSRTFGGLRLEPCKHLKQGKIDAPLGDRLVSPGALLLTYDFSESVLLPLS